MKGGGAAAAVSAALGAASGAMVRETKNICLNTR